MCKGDIASRNMKRNPTLIDERVLDFVPEIVDNETMKTLGFYHFNVS